MVKRLIILLLLISNITVAQTYGIEDLKKMLKSLKQNKSLEVKRKKSKEK